MPVGGIIMNVYLGHTDETLVNLAKRIPTDLNSDEPIFWIALGLG